MSDKKLLESCDKGDLQGATEALKAGARITCTDEYVS